MLEQDEKMLSINDLCVQISDGGPEILKGLQLSVASGEVHAIMGPNGSGKSTLANILAGHKELEVSQGSVLFDGEDLLLLEPHERACKGVFLAFQYPVALPGVSNMQFLKAAMNAQKKARGEEELSVPAFMSLVREKAKQLQLPEELLKRSINDGFSGGEKKRNEILQMAVLDPRLCIMDETDSGLDIDALKIVAQGVNSLRSPKRSIIIITHYHRILEYVKPDVVHVLVKGRIVRSGGVEVALELENSGYLQWST